MRILSWNVNSLRARLGRAQALVERHDPDILCLQETKVEDAGVPFFAFPEHTLTSHGQKSYNGVAFLSKEQPDEVRRGLPDSPVPDQARAITGRWGDVWVMNLYCINGKDVHHPDFLLKQQWYSAIRSFLDAELDPEQQVLLTGDFNITPTDIDSYMGEEGRGHVFHTQEERDWLAHLMDWGLTDLHREITDEQVFTWWDYRGLGFPQNKGLRIDLALGTDAVRDRLRDVRVDRDERKVGDHAEKPSDHAPILIDLG